MGFTGLIAQIVRVHQYGLRDLAEAGAKDMVYARREVLELTESELEMLRNGLLQHFGNSGRGARLPRPSVYKKNSGNVLHFCSLVM